MRQLRWMHLCRNYCNSSVGTTYSNSTIIPMIFSYGKGHLGSLGTGNFDDIENPMQLPTTKDLNIHSVSAGWAHAGFTTAEGDAYLYGRAHSFRDVLRANNIHRFVPWVLNYMNKFTLTLGYDSLLPVKLILPEEFATEKICQISCGAALTILRTESGKIFALGENGYGQCGTDVENMNVNFPMYIPVPDNAKIVDIAAGVRHALAVDEHGRVYSWGKGDRGQLGFGISNVRSPHEVIALKNVNVTNVSAGFNHSAVITDDGRAYVWGKLLNLDEDSDSKDQVLPRQVTFRDPVRLMQCSQFHTTFVTNDEKVWLVGRTPSGQYFQNDEFIRVSSIMHTKPLELKAQRQSSIEVKNVTQLGKGIDSTMFLTDAGNVYEWTLPKGIHKHTSTDNWKVKSLETGFHYRLGLGVPR